MNDNIVDANLRHSEGFLRRGAKRLCKQPDARRARKHFDLTGESHAGFFQIAAKLPVNQRHGRTVHYAIISGSLDSFEKASHVTCRVDAEQPGHQCAFTHYVDEHALTQFESERVSVADG